ncbi:hypothetical protein [Amycolatopsis sp. NPDC004079]|uniref:hypothetical protein n=1 Tax=Amycolatopsis sp. NPDC004079 TaxID=3154549 RepID=UPI00339F3C70
MTVCQRLKPGLRQVVFAGFGVVRLDVAVVVEQALVRARRNQQARDVAQAR